MIDVFNIVIYIVVFYFGYNMTNLVIKKIIEDDKNGVDKNDSR